MGQRAGGEAAARRDAVAACPGSMSTFLHRVARPPDGAGGRAGA
jgi:hypothetical protein